LVRTVLTLLICLASPFVTASPQDSAEPRLSCLIVNGLGGLPEYEENFVSWADRVEELFQAQDNTSVRRLDGREERRDVILQAFEETASGQPSNGEVWLFLIGHANHNGESFKFQIRGPDLTDSDISSFLSSLGSRRTFVVAATSASGSLLPDLEADNRVVVTATKSASERQPPLFLSFFLEATENAEADTDKNYRVSLLEAFLYARSRVATWYEDKGRLQTEHPLLNDRGMQRLSWDAGEGRPTSSGMLASVAYLSTPPESSYRSEEAKALVAERMVVQREIEELKFKKAEYPEEDYYRILQDLLVKLATLTEQIGKLEESL
jgi:hypothetical protein